MFKITELVACAENLLNYGSTNIYKIACSAPDIIPGSVSEFSFTQSNPTSCDRSNIIELPGATGTHGMCMYQVCGHKYSIMLFKNQSVIIKMCYIL